MDGRPWTVGYGLLSTVYCTFHFHHDRVLCCPKGKGCPAMGCQYVDTATSVYSVFVRFVPRALRDVYDARHNAWCDAARQDQGTARVIDFHFIAILNATCVRIDRIDEHALRKSFLQPVVVVMCGVDAVQGVMPDGLKGVFFI